MPDSSCRNASGVSVVWLAGVARTRAKPLRDDPAGDHGADDTSPLLLTSARRQSYSRFLMWIMRRDLCDLALQCRLTVGRMG